MPSADLALPAHRRPRHAVHDGRWSGRHRGPSRPRARTCPPWGSPRMMRLRIITISAQVQPGGWACSRSGRADQIGQEPLAARSPALLRPDCLVHHHQRPARPASNHPSERGHVQFRQRNHPRHQHRATVLADLRPLPALVRISPQQVGAYRQTKDAAQCQVANVTKARARPTPNIDRNADYVLTDLGFE
jgi:hypothetical protein